jgi:hypothetical protein
MRSYAYTRRPNDARICRIEDVALVHAYAQVSMIIRDQQSRQTYPGKRLTQSRSSQIAEYSLLAMRREVALGAHRAAYSAAVGTQRAGGPGVCGRAWPGSPSGRRVCWHQPDDPNWMKTLMVWVAAQAVWPGGSCQMVSLVL